MLMIIFGAGASYDSVAKLYPPRDYDGPYPNRPPLTNDIFHWDRAGDLIDRYVYLTPLVQELHSAGPIENMESALEVWQSKTRNSQARERALIALRFFLQARFSRAGEAWLHRPEVRGATNYLTLVRIVDEWRHEVNERVRMVTFNYDTLLDDACHRRVQLQTNRIEDYVSRDDFQLHKPHGSVNWGHLFDVPAFTVFGATWDSSAIEIISAAAEGHRDLGNYVLTTNGTMRQNQVVLPAIAVPLQSKAYFECPDIHKAKLEEEIPAVTRLLVIGWRASEKHFLDLLRGKARSVKKALVINGQKSNGSGADKNLESAGIENVKVLDLDFTQFVNSGELLHFLNA